MDSDFYRIRRLPPYVIAEVNAMKAAARARGEDIIDLGMGNPDAAPPPHVIDKLCEVASKPNAHGYSASKGIPGLPQGAGGLLRAPLRSDGRSGDARWSSPSARRRVSPTSPKRSPRRAMSFSRPIRAYPIHTFGFIIAGAAIRSMPTTPDEDFFRRLELSLRYTVPRPEVLVVSYPSNPTA